MSYSNPEITKKILDELSDNLNKFNYESLKAVCNSILPAIPIQIVNFDNSNFYFKQREFGGANVIYRAREIVNADNIPFGNISEISYVPVEHSHKIKFGRANKPGESMFYGSFDYATACAEAITNEVEFLQKGSTMLVVGIWKCKTPLLLAQLPHSEKNFKKFYETVNFKSEGIQLEHIIKKNIKEKSSFASDIEFEILKFFADEFARFEGDKDSQYFLSNYYKDRIFNKIPGYKLTGDVDGIIYPSVTLSYQHRNIVIKPEVIENKFKFGGAMLVWVVASKNGNSGPQFIPIHQQVIADASGNLQWL